MYLTSEQIQQTCGILICNDSNRFVYYCTKCRSEFYSGVDLEEHIVFDHHDKKKHIDGIFIDDGIVLEETTAILSALPFVSLIKTEVIPSAIAPVPIDQVIDSTTETIDTAESADETEQQEQPLQQQQSPSTSDDQSDHENVPYDEQNEAITINEPVECSSRNCDVSTESNVFEELPVDRKKNQKRAQNGTLYCEMCPGRSFRTLHVIRAHMKQHVNNKLNKPCPLCLVYPQNYEKHMRYAHTEAKPYKCDLCDASFKHNMGRVVHMRTHTDERPYLCASCGKAFKSEDSRRKHNIRMHSEQLPHPCHTCDRRFINPSQLQDHIYSTHSTERPYTCEICGRSYATRKYLRKHHQSHGERIHLCDYCGKKFKTTETRRWHLRKVHKILR